MLGVDVIRIGRWVFVFILFFWEFFVCWCRIYSGLKLFIDVFYLLDLRLERVLFSFVFIKVFY